MRLLRVRRRVDDRLRLLAHCQKIIWVIPVKRSHCEYSSRVDVHRDRACAVERIVIDDGLTQMLFDKILDRRIDRRDNVAAIFPRNMRGILLKHRLGPIGVCFAHR